MNVLAAGLLLFLISVQCISASQSASFPRGSPNDVAPPLSLPSLDTIDLLRSRDLAEDVDAQYYSIYFFQWFSSGGGIDEANGGGGCRTPEPAPTIACGGEGRIEVMDFYMSDHDCAVDDDSSPGSLTCAAQEEGCILVACRGNEFADLDIAATLPQTSVPCDGKVGGAFMGTAKQWAYLYAVCSDGAGNDNFIVRDDDVCTAAWGAGGEPYCYDSGICQSATFFRSKQNEEWGGAVCVLPLEEVTIKSRHDGDEACVYDPPVLPYCGDGVCDSDEDQNICPDDCPSFCGDGTCNDDEDHATCPDDCPPICGDGICDDGEDRDLCPLDCAVCGDGNCDDGENNESCPEDCHSVCGDGTCDKDEDVTTCPSDCPDVSVGTDGTNDGAERGESTDETLQDNTSGNESVKESGGSSSASTDSSLQEEGSQASTPEICGDGICSIGENHSNCAQDCPATCGDGTCDENEDRTTCPADCTPVRVCPDGGCLPKCGDGVCKQPDENNENCPEDCSASSSSFLRSCTSTLQIILVSGTFTLVYM